MEIFSRSTQYCLLAPVWSDICRFVVALTRCECIETSSPVSCRWHQGVFICSTSHVSFSHSSRGQARDQEQKRESIVQSGARVSANVVRRLLFALQCSLHDRSSLHYATRLSVQPLEQGARCLRATRVSFICRKGSKSSVSV